MVPLELAKVPREKQVVLLELAELPRGCGCLSVPESDDMTPAWLRVELAKERQAAR